MIRLLRHKTTWTKIISVLSVVIFAGLLVTVAAILLSDRQRVMDNNTRLIEIYGELYEQTEQQGIEPTTPDPGQVEKESREAVVGPRGATGPVGNVGPRGPQGEMGLRGQDGPPGPAGESVTGPKGDTGAAGEDGQSIKGDQGAAGADSEVPGPQGPVGATGPQGAAGADSTVPGPQGAIGPIGPAGPQGAAGTGIVSITCSGNTMTVNFTDGTSSTLLLGTTCMPGE